MLLTEFTGGFPGYFIDCPPFALSKLREVLLGNVLGDVSHKPLSGFWRVS